jgi:perosamine synthetase
VRSIPVARPALIGNEKAYVLDCLESTWISSNGKYIELFEAQFATLCGVKHGLSCCNGTAALHLALLALGIGPGDEVIVPTLTFVATANAVAYCGARPVFVDSEPVTWNLDPELIQAKITPRTRAIIAVHLYGHPADMDQILEVARQHHLWVIEDAAEAHGAAYKGRPVGSLGDIATFSFYGNKVITTGEGGMVVTNNDEWAARVRLFKGQGLAPDRRYWFSVAGYNYRMTNIAAAIGLAQLEKIDWHLARRREIAAQYAERLARIPGLTMQPEMSLARHTYWMVSVVLTEPARRARDAVMAQLFQRGIETRPFFYPMHTLPMYRAETNGHYPVAERISAHGFNLPTYADLDPETVDHICDELSQVMGA